MTSLRGRLVQFLLKNRHLFRLRFRPERVDWADREAILRFRERCEEGARRFGKVPPGIGATSVNIDGLSAEWVTPMRAASEGVILFFHGGGYASGSCADHRIHVAKFVAGTGMRALLFEYRLAPEHTFPAALDDSVKAYRWLLAQGVSPSSICFAGDSAGGGLCLATLLALRETGIPLPAAAVALSPWTDLRCAGDSYRENAAKCLSPEGSWTAFSRHYVGTNDPGDPWISPLYGALHGLPPLLIYAGSNEILLDDAVGFARAAKRAGVEATLKIGAGLFHCYPVCAPMFPEATESMHEICEFIVNMAGGATVERPGAGNADPR